MGGLVKQTRSTNNREPNTLKNSGRENGLLKNILSVARVAPRPSANSRPAGGGHPVVTVRCQAAGFSPGEPTRGQKQKLCGRVSQVTIYFV